MQEAEQVAARPRNAAAGSAGTWRGFLVTSTTILGSASPGHQSPPIVPQLPLLPSPRQGCVAWSASAAAGCSVVASPETGLELYNQHYSQVTEASLLSRS